MASANDLNDIHRNQLTRYALFFKGKRDKMMSDRTADLEDFKTDRLSDSSTIFNASDVEGLLDFFFQQMQGHVREDLEQTTNLAGVYVSQLLAQAEQYGLAMQVDDISVIEDQHRLGSMSALTALSGVPPPVAKKPTLTTLGSGLVPDVQAVQQLQELKAENDQLMARYQQMQIDNAALLKERSELQQAMDQLVAEAHSVSQSGGQYEQTIHNMKVMCDSKQHEIDQLRQEVNQRLAESVQFVQLKDLLKKKSAQLKELKQVCIQYGIPLPSEEGGFELAAED